MMNVNRSAELLDVIRNALGLEGCHDALLLQTVRDLVNERDKLKATILRIHTAVAGGNGPGPCGKFDPRPEIVASQVETAVAELATFRRVRQAVKRIEAAGDRIDAATLSLELGLAPQ